MLLNFKVKGYKNFTEQVELDLTAQNGKNIHVGKTNVLKSAIIYGKNNQGKSNLIEAIAAFKKVVLYNRLDEVIENMNWFTEERQIEFEVTFLSGKDIYLYGVTLFEDKSFEEYLYINEEIVFLISEEENIIPSKKHFKDYEIVIIEGFFKLNSLKHLNNLFMNTLKVIPGNKMLDNFFNFFKKITIFYADKNLIETSLLYDFLNRDSKFIGLYNKLIKSADVKLVERIIDKKNEFLKKEKLTKKDKLDKLKSKYIYKGKEKIVGIMYDSVGTNKFAHLLAVILDSIEKNHILFIDEIDNSLHYRLTREITRLLNSNINNKAQFIMTSHDVKLLSNAIFRKEQINLMDENEDGDVEVYSYGDFAANSENDIRNTSNFENIYVKGKVGALPNSDFYMVIENYEEKK